jgi:GTP-binding protein
MLVDQATITIEAGTGGNGCLSFRREKFIPYGGPDGGNGGRGGDVILEASADVRTLVDFSFQPIYQAKHGGHGLGKNQFGRDSENVVVKVPPGTMVYLESGELLVDMAEVGQTFLAARGGRGGKGNSCFTTATRQAPRLAERGEPGETKILRLELKLLADVGLLGFPNAGKSTLLSRVTAARPKIAEYPFTTLEPQLGVVRLSGDRSFVMADVPGLIEGASQGKGLGLQFLKHLERTQVLLHLVEAPEAPTLKDLQKRIKVIENELSQYPSGLADLPRLLVITKIDACADRAQLEKWKKSLEKKGHQVFLVSAVSGEGLQPLLEATWALMEKVRSEVVVQEPVEEHKVFKPEQRFTVLHEGRKFYVEGAEIRKWTAMTDFGTRGGVERFHHILYRMGVFAELKRQGLKIGDTVICADQEFNWDGDEGKGSR